MRVGRAAKFVVAAVAAGAITAQAAITDGAITTAEWIAIAIAALGALGVYGVKNAKE